MLGFTAVGEVAVGQATRLAAAAKIIEWLVRARRRARR
jgi:hypothetical protein